MPKPGDKSLQDFSETEDQHIADFQSKIFRLEQKVATTSRTLKAITKENSNLMAEREAYFDGLVAGEKKPPVWATRKQRKTKGQHNAIPALFLSDLHLDEVVEPAQMHYANAYNREIAEIRFHHTIEMACELPTEYFTGLTYDGIVVLCGGDWFAGQIHPELVDTNSGTILDGLVHWTPIIAGAFKRLADTYGKVATYWTYGNHGRLSPKSRYKGAARDNIEWVLAHQVRQILKDDPRITFVIPDATDIDVPIYNTRIRLEHGNLGMGGGGGGIAGVLSPLLAGVSRASRQAGYENRPFDLLACGHWHQETYLPARGLIVNGSMVGYDEYAKGLKLQPESAKQSLFIVTPENGVSFSAPINCQNRKAEGW